MSILLQKGKVETSIMRIVYFRKTDFNKFQEMLSKILYLSYSKSLSKINTQRETFRGAWKLLKGEIQKVLYFLIKL